MNKYKKLAGNTIIFAIGSFGSKILSFFLTRLYTGCLSSEEFSSADLIYQAVNVIYPIVTLSMADAVIRFGMEKKNDMRSIFTVAVSATVMGLALLSLLSPLFNLTEMYNGYAFLLYVCCYCSCLRQIAANFVRAKGYVKLFALDGIIAILTMVISNIIFLLVLDMGVIGYVMSFIVSDFLSFSGLCLIAGLHKYLDFKYFSTRLFKNMLKYSAPLIPTYVLWWITSSSDRWIVTTICGKGINGVYSVANKIPTLLMMFTTVFFQAWQMSAIENRDDRGLSKFYSKVYGAYSSLLAIAAAGVILFVRPLTYLIVHGRQVCYTLVNFKIETNFLFSYNYTPMLVIAMVFQCLCQFLSSVYNVKKKSVNSMITSFIAAIVNIVLNFMLIPKYGAYGAALATAAAYASCFIVRIFDVRRLIPFKAGHMRMLINTVLVAAMAFISIAEVSLAYLWLILIFLLVTAFNFGAVLSTLKKVFNRRSSGGEN